MYPTAMRNTPPPEREGLFFGYVAVVCAAAVALTAVALPHLASRITGGSTKEFWILAGLAVISDAWPVTTPGGRSSLTVFPSICFTFAVMLMFGVAAAVIVQAAAVIVSSVQLRHAPWRGLFNASQYALSFAAAGAVLHGAHGMPFATGNEPGWAGVLVAAVAGSVWFGVNYTLVTGAVWLRFGGSWWRLVRRSISFDALTTGALLLLAPVLVGAAHFSAALIPLVLLPLIAVNRFARVFNEQDRIATTDRLTQLANRTALMAEVAAQVALCGQRSAADGRTHHFALLVLDIDRFKYVNDALGHDVGDRLLAEIGSRLRRAASGSLVARLGGDEYAVVVPDVATVDDALHAAERISDTLSVPPVVLDGLSLDVAVSIGVALYPQHGADDATLMRHADVAMYEAKTRGDAVAAYAPEADHNSPARLGLLADLRRALEDPGCTEVAFYYQPQVEMASGEVVGVEALLRWHHPDRGMIDPEELIRLAEHSGVMRLLTLRVVDDVVAQLAAWRSSGLRLRAAINVSVRDLHTSEIVDRLADRLAYHEVEPDILQLEITESALMADPRQVLSTLQRLRKIGIALSLDDFGTGYSSMQHLRRLPLAEVKIDRSFVLGMADDGDDEAIVRSIIELAGALGLRVVAEGVEDDRTRRLLLEAGCHIAQGWYYARPMPADDLVGWLARYRPPQQQLDAAAAERPVGTGIPAEPAESEATPT